MQELDDRGLLNGGGSNRSSSVRQKNRRPLEMRNREARLHDRNIEVRQQTANFVVLCETCSVECSRNERAVSHVAYSCQERTFS